MAEKIILDDDLSEVAALSEADIASKKVQRGEDYADVTGQYPRRPYSGLSGVNKAATGNQKNHVYTGGGDKLVNLKESIPESRYTSATYTKNQVRESPSGHVTEIDDTPGSERVLNMHRSGSGVEMLADGTVIYSSTGNTVRVVLKDEKVIVEGNAQMSYNGNLTLDVSGDFDVKVGGNYNVEVAGTKNERILGSSVSKISKQQHIDIGTHKLENVGGTETKQVFGNQNNIVKGYMHHIVEGVIQINSKGDLTMTTEKTGSWSGDNVNIAANDMSVFGATGTFGGDGVLFSGKGAVFEEGVTAPTFHGNLKGLAEFASTSNHQNYPDPTSPGGGVGSPNWSDGTHNTAQPAITKPNATNVGDYLSTSDKCIGKVSIDNEDLMVNSLPGRREKYYGNVTTEDPTTAESRALLKDPDNMANQTFTGALVSTEKVSDKFNNPTPPVIGRVINPANVNFRGNKPIGQSGRRSAKRFRV